MAVQLPNVQQPFVEPNTGLVNRTWYLALLNLNNQVVTNVVTSVNISGNNGITAIGGPITSSGVFTLGIGNLTCASAQIAGTVTAANAVIVGTLSAANISTGGLLATGTLTAANIVDIGTFSAARAIVSGTVTAANIISTGTITANNVVISAGLTFMSPTQTFLGSDQALSNTSYQDIVTTGSIGGAGQTWLILSTVTLTDTAGAASPVVRIWDGTTVFKEIGTDIRTASAETAVTLSAIVTPAGAATYRVSAKDLTSPSGKALTTGNAGTANKASSITALRIA